MRSIHKLSKLCDIIGLQCLYCLQRSLVLINCVLCPSDPCFVLDRRLIFFKLLFTQLAKALDIYYLLQLCQCCFALASSFIVLGIPKSSLLVAAGDHDLRIL